MALDCSYCVEIQEQKLTPTLPILFLIGSYIKYSFAIYAICILFFLWSERLTGLAPGGIPSILKKKEDILQTSYPLIATGVLYIIGRHYLINSEGSPLQEWSNSYSLKEILAYTPIMPLTSIADLQDSLIHCVAKLSGKDYSEAWMRTASLLSYISPFILIPYISLVAKKKPLLRFLGVTALATVSIFSTLYLLKYTIGLRERYYQQAAILLLIATAAYGAENRRFSRLAQVFIAGVMVVGVFKFTRTTHANLMGDSIMPVGNYGFSIGAPPSLVNKIQSIAQNNDSIIAISSPVLALELDSMINSSTHILPPLGRRGFSTYKGRVSQVTIVEPVSAKRNLKDRFVAYAENEWECYTIDNWIFWQTKCPIKKSPKR